MSALVEDLQEEELCVRFGRNRVLKASMRLARSPTRSTRSIPGNRSPTTARRRSTGGGISTTTRSSGFQRELATMGYGFQFITLAGFHALNASMFDLAHGYAREGMPAYVRLQEREFEMEALGYTATRHQAEVGTGYFDRVSEVVSGGRASTLSLRGSTEEAQFEATPSPNGKGGHDRSAEREPARD